MSAPLSEQQLTLIRAQLGAAQPATNGLIASCAKAVQDMVRHDHTTQREDWFCMNLAAYMGEHAGPVLRRLLDAETRVAELEATELTVFRASHPESGIGLGHYAGRQAAMDHVHATLANEESTTAAAIELRVIWRADDPEADDTAWECWLHDEDGADDSPTGYVVTPITVAVAYDPDGEE